MMLVGGSASRVTIGLQGRAADGDEKDAWQRYRGALSLTRSVEEIWRPAHAPLLVK